MTRILLNLAVSTGVAMSGLMISTAVQAAETKAAQAAASDSQRFYHQKVGNYQVYALFDGVNSLGVNVFKGKAENELRSILAENWVDSDAGIRTSVNGYLVDTGNGLVLIDTGGGSCAGSNLGHLQDSLQAAGFEPEDIDAVLLTHLHPDHLCGIQNPDGSKAYPNATVYLHTNEADYWLNPQTLLNMPAEQQEAQAQRFATIANAIKPYQESQTVELLGDGEEVISGITVVPSHGHTAGHTSYMIHSQGSQMLVMGDLVHNAALQFAYPDISIVYDTDPKAAVVSRYAVFTDAAEAGYLVTGDHLPFPGIGTIALDADEGKAFVWQPVEDVSSVLPSDVGPVAVGKDSTKALKPLVK